MRITLVLVICLLALACSPKKQETSTTTVDSVGVDNVLAPTPAAPLLAFDVLNGFAIRKEFETPDSVNYLMISNQEGLDRAFTHDKGTPVPDFIINYVLAVACKPSQRATTLRIDTVEAGESSIDVYLKITRGAPGGKATPAAIFAIERREGYPVMQFFVNGKKDKSLVLAL